MNRQKVKEGASPTQEKTSPVQHVWNPNLYRLQQEAPRPKVIVCLDSKVQCPWYYGCEYHGVMSHLEAAALLKEEGSYLVRQSSCTNGFYTLSLRYFQGASKQSCLVRQWIGNDPNFTSDGKVVYC